MKKMIYLALFIFFVAIISACTTEYKATSYFEEQYIIEQGEVNHIRVGTVWGFSKLRSSVDIIASVDALNSFYQLHQDVIHFDTSYFGKAPAFDALVLNYDSAFFQDNILLILIIDENSGSIRHEVEQLSVDEGVLSIYMYRDIPEIFTHDMATWLVVIELERSAYTFESARLVWHRYNE